MPAEPALALIVRGSDWSETSRIVTLWTREFGKVRALAKGGRRLRSSFEVALDVLTVTRVMLIRKHQGGLDLLTEALLDRRYPHLRTSLNCLTIGYYIAELLADGTQDGDPHPALFDQSLEILALPDSSPLDVIRFELAWLHELGYSPRLDACVLCSRIPAESHQDSVRIGISPEAGGVVCSACQGAVRDRRLIGQEALSLLRKATTPSIRMTGSLQAVHELRGLLSQTVSVILGRRPRLLDSIEKLKP